MNKPKVFTKYDAIDLAQLITDFFINIESPEGKRFKAMHLYGDIVTVRINQRTFIINITEKDKLS
jgi:hypothetical protein